MNSHLEHSAERERVGNTLVGDPHAETQPFR